MNSLKIAAHVMIMAMLLLSRESLAQTIPEKESENEDAMLEVITVTAQKRTQSIQEVPISIVSLNGEGLDSLFSGGDDILALAVRVPGLYAESSNGRAAPRFYLRGLGNTDFDLAASQPVAIIMDDVVMENVVLKSFPLFDVQHVEVIRGPQGTLYGRNTTAGIVKFDTVKPTDDFNAFAKLGLGSFGTERFEGAVGGGLNDVLSARVSVLSQKRNDYIDNAYTGQNNALGGFDEKAWRAQLLFQPNDDLSLLLNVHGRDLTGTLSVFRANIFTKGANGLNENYDRLSVYYDGDLTGDGADNNPQEFQNIGSSLTVEYDMGSVSLHSISAIEKAQGYSLGDVDGGVTLEQAADINGDGTVETSFPGFIPFSAVTQDVLDDLQQFTQEIRFASNTKEAFAWQVGAFFFDSSFNVTSIDGFFGATTVFHENTSWALFTQTAYQVNSKLNLTAGIRYTYDEKSLVVGEQNVAGIALDVGAAAVQDYAPIKVDSGQESFEVSANYRVNDDISVFARFANGFRAQTIQGRDVAFEGAPSVAEPETINSVETGFKSDLLNNTFRLNAAVYYYQIDDIQFSAIGGGNNFTALINADKGIGHGFEVDAQWLATNTLTFTIGYSYNHTEIKDQTLTVQPCGSSADYLGNCTVLDPRTSTNQAFVNGNPFPQAPKTTANFSVRYAIPVDANGELFFYSDWALQGKTNLFLYDSIEFTTDGNIEGGLRIGYENFADGYQIAVFGRNITNENNVKGAIDFNNLTGSVNEPRIWGAEIKFSFH